MAAVLVNGINYSWSNLTNAPFGVPVIGIKAISWTRKQKKENNYGLGTEPISRGYGNAEYEGTMTVYKDWWQSVVNSIPTKNPLDIPPFDWPMSYGGPGVQSISETLRNFEFLEDGTKANQGDTALLIDVPFIFAGVLRS